MKKDYANHTNPGGECEKIQHDLLRAQRILSEKIKEAEEEKRIAKADCEREKEIAKKLEEQKSSIEKKVKDGIEKYTLDERTENSSHSIERVIHEKPIL